MTVKKTSNKKADKQKLMVRIVCAALVVVMILTTLVAVIPFDTHTDTTYYINENGEVVTADGTVIGLFDELFGGEVEEDHTGHDHD